MTGNDVAVTTYEEFMDGLAAGMPGRSIELHLQGFDGGDSADGDYTVYWPRDGFRVIEGASYAIARTVSCILRDERTRWMGEPTSQHLAVISRVRRNLHRSAVATIDQVRGRKALDLDLMLPADIRTIVDDPYTAHFVGPGPRAFDFATLPE